MVTNKNVRKLKQSILYLTFLSSDFFDTIHVAFVDTVFVTFVDTLSVTFIISSHSITELSAILFQYLLFPQIHVLGFQLYYYT